MKPAELNYRATGNCLTPVQGRSRRAPRVGGAGRVGGTTDSELVKLCHTGTRVSRRHKVNASSPFNSGGGGGGGGGRGPGYFLEPVSSGVSPA